MVSWYIGTMGFSYADWNGFFYPSEMEARNYLGYYSRIFNCVEIDSTFYGTPRQAVVLRWAAATPEGFRFCLKMPRSITHDARLAGTCQQLGGFLDAVRRLGEKLGVILIQFPPSFKANEMEALEQMIQRLPGDLRFAVEIRSPSWYTHSVEQGVGIQIPALASMLARYQVAWAATEYPGLPGAIYPTAKFLYLRWIGQHGTFQHHSSERIDRTHNLVGWIDKMRPHLEGVEAVYGMFNNDYAGFAAGTANRFKELAGLPVNSFQLPVQRKMF